MMSTTAGSSNSDSSSSTESSHPSSTSTTTTTVPFIAANHINDQTRHLLLAATGSVATIKLPLILHALSHHASLSIRLVLTRAATRFLAGQSAEQPQLSSLLDIKNVDGIYTDDDEWNPPWQRGKSVLHIELRRWADMMVVAPLSANSMAKVVGGWADSLLLSVIRAWDTTGEIDGRGGGGWLGGDDDDVGSGGEATKHKQRKKRIIVAPAMNTAMWRHPVTVTQLKVLEQEWGVDAPGGGGWIEVLRPVEKVLACGDAGDGAMREWREVVAVIEERLGYND